MSADPVAGATGAATVGGRELAGVPVRRVVLGGAPVDLVDRDGLLRIVEEGLRGTAGPFLVASANLDHVSHFGAGGPLEGFFDRSRWRDGWLVLLDGMPLVARAHRLTGREWPLLAGSDLLPDMVAAAERTGASFGVVGGTAEMHARLAEVLSARWPRLTVAGMWAPTPQEVADPDGRRRVAEAVAAAGTDLLAVCLGKPKQERWIDELLDVAGPRVALCFGAAAEFLAGTEARAPVWARRLHAEWAWRLLRDPKRLWRRYLVKGPPAYLALRRHSRA